MRVVEFEFLPAHLTPHSLLPSHQTLQTTPSACVAAFRAGEKIFLHDFFFCLDKVKTPRTHH